MERLLATLLVLGLALASMPRPVPAEQFTPAQTEQMSDDPVQLVQQLGDRNFAVRRRATARLVELGILAAGPLERGVQSKDREISFRARHALKIVRENDFQRRLRAFASGLESAESYHLPGWARFAKEVGTGPDARALFVEMQQAEPKILAAIEETPERVDEVLRLRIGYLQDAIAQGHQSNQLPLGTIASILFVLNGQDIELSMLSTQSIGSYFRYPSFAGAIQAGSQRDVLRKMLAVWIEKSKGWDAYHAMFLSMQYGIPVGLAPAQRILHGELEQQNQTYFLCYALLTCARFGDASQYSLIETLLDNKTPYGGTIAMTGKKKFQTQIRDIALATLVHLEKLDHKDFGFTRFRSHGSQVFNTSSVAFENDEKRDIAIQKWFEYRRRQGE